MRTGKKMRQGRRMIRLPCRLQAGVTRSARLKARHLPGKRAPRSAMRRSEAYLSSRFLYLKTSSLPWMSTHFQVMEFLPMSGTSLATW